MCVVREFAGRKGERVREEGGIEGVCVYVYVCVCMCVCVCVGVGVCVCVWIISTFCNEDTNTEGSVLQCIAVCCSVFR